MAAGFADGSPSEAMRKKKAEDKILLAIVWATAGISLSLGVMSLFLLDDPMEPVAALVEWFIA